MGRGAIMKTAHRQASQAKRQMQALQSNPIAIAVARSRHAARAHRQAQAEQELAERITRDVRGLQIDAGVHAWTGQDASRMVNLGGRLLYIVAHAAVAAGVPADHVDLRIMRGMSEALGDLVDNLDDVERHRGSIQSGLGAIGRLLPQCAAFDLLAGSYDLDEKLHTTRGMSTNDVRQAMGIAA